VCLKERNMLGTSLLWNKGKLEREQEYKKRLLEVGFIGGRAAAGRSPAPWQPKLPTAPHRAHPLPACRRSS
jgi:hypothetical protein